MRRFERPGSFCNNKPGGKYLTRVTRPKTHPASSTMKINDLNDLQQHLGALIGSAQSASALISSGSILRVTIHDEVHDGALFIVGPYAVYSIFTSLSSTTTQKAPDTQVPGDTTT